MGGMFELIALSGWEFSFLGGVMFVAGLVRGFTGFALSALAMVIAGPAFGPVFLIPVLFWQESAASMAMLRAGWKDADKLMAVLMAVGSSLAVPFGIWLTLSISKDVSGIVALCIIMSLAIMQLARVRMDFLVSNIGTFITGLGAGVVTGLESGDK